MRLGWILLTIGLTFGFIIENIEQPEVEADTVQLAEDAPRLVLAQEDGATDPDALGAAAPAESEPILVELGIRIQQITGIDQKSENFGLVADLKMQFQDPKLGFDPQSCDCTSKILHVDELVDLARASGTTWPEFFLFNRQGRVSYDVQLAEIQADGSVSFFERFSTTLQAPDFDFLQHPFDRQHFFVRILSYFPEDYYVFRELPDWSWLGEQLGEEEWTLTNLQSEISAIPLESGSNLHSMISFSFEGERHVTYYIFRIFLPVFIIILVSWFIFFLRDYSKRIDIATTNLLLFIAFNFVISGDLPRLGYLTFLDAMLVSTFVVTGLIVIINVYLRRLEISERTDLARTIDRYVLWCYPIGYVLGVGAVMIFFFV